MEKTPTPNPKPKLLPMIFTIVTALILTISIFPGPIPASGEVNTYVTTEETGPLIPHEPQAYSLDCATDVVMNLTTNEKVCDGINNMPYLYPGDTVHFIPTDGDWHVVKGFCFTYNPPVGHATAYTFACEDDGKVHVEVTGTQAWGEPDEKTGENLYITDIKILGDELVKLYSGGGGDYTSTWLDKKLVAVYCARNLGFMHVPSYCQVNTELWYNFNEEHLMTDEEAATAAYYDDEPSTTVVWAEDAYANYIAGTINETRPYTMTVRRPYIEGYAFSEYDQNVPSTYSSRISKAYKWLKSDTWHGNRWEGWIDNIVEFVPYLNNATGGWEYDAYGTYDQAMFIRLIYYPNRTLTLDACGGTIDGYPTRIYEAAGCRQYWDKELTDGVVDAQYAAGEKYIPVREGYTFEGWYEDPEYTTKVNTFKETLAKFSTNPYDALEKHVCRMYAKWEKIKADPELTFAAETVTRTFVDAAFTNELTKVTDGTVTFASGDTAVADVDENGLVTIKGLGTTTITVEASEGEDYKAGSASYELTVEPASIAKASVSGLSLSYGYRGKAYEPSFQVILNGVTLVSGTDYTYEYSDNINPGTAKITVVGKGNYTGTRIRTFEIVDCVSTLVSGKTYQLIPKNNSSTAVCSFAGRMINNTKVYITDRSSSEAMKFVAIKNSDGSWKFINAKCELALAVQQNSSLAGKGLVLYNQTTRKAQNWKLTRKSDNSFAITNAVSGLYVSMSDMSAPKGTLLTMNENSGRGDQRFYIVETTAVSAPFDGTYAVKASKNKAFGLNIASSSKTDGANVNLYTYSGNNAQKFKVIYSGGGYYRLENVNSGLVVSVKGNTKTNGANVIQSAWKAQSGQRWKITKNSNGTVTFKNALGTVLHLVSNSTKNGTNVQARTASTTTAQKWYLQ